MSERVTVEAYCWVWSLYDREIKEKTKRWEGRRR